MEQQACLQIYKQIWSLSFFAQKIDEFTEIIVKTSNDNHGMLFDASHL
jgi:uncharacterized protein involved in tolerance to divalent cations